MGVHLFLQVSFSACFSGTITAIFMHMLLFLFFLYLNMLILLWSRPTRTGTERKTQNFALTACKISSKIYEFHTMFLECLWAAFASNCRVGSSTIYPTWRDVTSRRRPHWTPKKSFDVTIGLSVRIHMKQSDYNHRFSTERFGGDFGTFSTSWMRQSTMRAQTTPRYST